MNFKSWYITVSRSNIAVCMLVQLERYEGYLLQLENHNMRMKYSFESSQGLQLLAVFLDRNCWHVILKKPPVMLNL